MFFSITSNSNSNSSFFFFIWRLFPLIVMGIFWYSHSSYRVKYIISYSLLLAKQILKSICEIWIKLVVLWDVMFGFLALGRVRLACPVDWLVGGILVLLLLLHHHFLALGIGHIWVGLLYWRVVTELVLLSALPCVIPLVIRLIPLVVVCGCSISKGLLVDSLRKV